MTRRGRHSGLDPLLLRADRRGAPGGAAAPPAALPAERLDQRPLLRDPESARRDLHRADHDRGLWVDPGPLGGAALAPGAGVERPSRAAGVARGVHPRRPDLLLDAPLLPHGESALG